jgi:hypothetical protein
LKDKVEELKNTKQDLELEINEHMWARQELRSSEERYHSLISQKGNSFDLHEILCDDNGLPYD